MENAKNACEEVLADPELNKTILGMARSCFAKHRVVFDDAGYDLEDVQQELYLALCEEKPCRDHCHLVGLRLLDIVRDIGRRNRCETIEYDDDDIEVAEVAALAV